MHSSFCVIQVPLQVVHVEPAAELEPDLPEVPDADEPEALVQDDAGGLLGVDAGDDGVVPGRPRPVDQVREDRAPDSLPLVVGVVPAMLTMMVRSPVMLASSIPVTIMVPTVMPAVTVMVSDLV